MNITGTRHHNMLCGNSPFDQMTSEEFYLIEYGEKLRMESEELTWVCPICVPYMLEVFWQNGIQSKGGEFLEKTSFLYCFRYITAARSPFNPD